MRNTILFCVLVCFGVFFCKISSAQTNTFPATGSAGIGTTSPNSSSLLDVTSTTKGVLFPRMTKAQRDVIATPATGLLIYQTNSTPGFYYYSGTAWTAVTAKGANASLSNLKSPTAINQSLIPGLFQTIDLGSSSLPWNNMYLAGSIYMGGQRTLYSNGSNSAAGANSFGYNTTGNQNEASGVYALYANSTGSANSANGYAALYSNDNGSYNSASGALSLYNNTGSFNTADGYSSLFSNTSGNYNTANGSNALYANTDGSSNTATGSQSLEYNTSGGTNTACGFQALISNSIGFGNTACGSQALYSNTYGANNTTSGVLALISNTSGYYNTALGAFTDANDGSYYNSSAFGSNALITASDQVRIGDNYVTSIGGYVNWSNISDGRFKKNINDDVKGLDFINKLQPVTYTLDIHGMNNFLRKDMPKIKTPDGEIIERPKEDEDAIASKEKIIYSGFIAQDVEKAANEVGYDFSGVDAPKNDKDVYGLRYAEFVVPLVKAVQELSQQNDVLKKEVEDLKSTIQNPNSEMTSGFAELKTLNTKPETILGQNIPNPFDNSTLIPFRIPKNCHDASIMITNTSLNEVVSVIPISCNEDHVSIDAGSLASGTYSYTLYVDGKVVDTKSMVLTK